MMKKDNHRGSVLQIVLIILCTICFFLTIYVSDLEQKFLIYKNIAIMERQKNYEVMLIHYYKKTLKDDILISDEFNISGHQFRYSVDIDVNSYIITTTFLHPYFNYDMVCEIDNESYQVLKLEYKEKK